ncbi:hypothetical protein BDV26DRAFT_287215 [Aspergillus bertholletiae]|uniref:Uncharacterized protein n=1 Tax=Aspergillus bertholletiae TaxID=1226010 RepID=A0A5N7BQN7_9EURO|nr:hypothetical protein BDV26DRAFT_287215 [Aspergillus bertholletiae]
MTSQPPLTPHQPNKQPLPSPESEVHRTALEAAKLHRRRLEHAVLLSALRARVPYSSLPGILASLSPGAAGRASRYYKYGYDYTDTYHDNYDYSYRDRYHYSYESGYECVYVVPGGVVLEQRTGVSPYPLRRVLDDSFLTRAYKKRDLVRQRKSSSGKSSGRGSIGSDVAVVVRDERS